MTIPELHHLFLNATGVSIDTRTVKQGDLYFALKGDNFDGNRFASQALASGAQYAIIDDKEFEGEKTILVKDVLHCLQELGKHHRNSLKIPFIGLTGSNGKTTTKELIAAALSNKFKVAFTKGNLNNHIGVPLTLLSIRPEHEIAIIEMGANHQKEIEFLCSLCQPDYGYITNFGKAHLEGFGGVEGVIKGKSELYDFLRSHSKKVFVNLDDPLQLEKSQGIALISFGTANEAETKVRLSDHTAKTIALEFDNQVIQTRLTGNYNFSNVGVAIAMARYFGVSSNNIKKGIEAYTPQNNRSQVEQTEKNQLILDTYNANPSSMKEALLNFNDFPGLHKWAILGDMFEMGEYEALEHQAIANLAISQGFEKIVLVGEAFSKSTVEDDHRVLQFNTTKELLEFLKTKQLEGKTILLKGSRGMRIETATKYL